jgi:hypothetical protein
MIRALATAAILLAAAAPAQAQDSVTGTASTGEGRAFVEFTFDAHSGPSGENPTGTVHIDALLIDLGFLPVTCLNVSGNRATVVVAFPISDPAGAVIWVEDGPDGVTLNIVDVLPTACPVTTDPLVPIGSGDIVVTDAQPFPTTKDQCKHGGWRAFSQFKNQGGCVRFVNSRPD